jgi:acyl phosphate:glycerol-3-phosphate acyltransferase
VSPGALAVHTAAAVLAYLVGAIPFGFILVRLTTGRDVRSVGSGNIGATNAARAAGPAVGILAFTLDVTKGFLAATAIPFIAFIILNGGSAGQGGPLIRQMVVSRDFDDLRMICGLAAIVGHVWPIFLDFKGGKGVATSLGVLLGLAPGATLIALGVWIVVTGVSRYVSLGSIIAAVALPIAFALVDRGRIAADYRLLGFTVLVALLVIIRHRSNIARLLAGTENRVRFGRSKSA